jgi:hypothetical protein
LSKVFGDTLPKEAKGKLLRLFETGRSARDMRAALVFLPPAQRRRLIGLSAQGRLALQWLLCSCCCF